MQASREYLLELDKQRTVIEEEIMSLTNFLNSEGMPGVNGSLIDKEGFPIQGVDIMAVRTARNKLISKFFYKNLFCMPNTRIFFKFYLKFVFI
jgi:hypothetical protein